MGNAYPEAFSADPDAGIAVYTHVFRLNHRLGLAGGKDPGRTEKELMAIIPRGRWNSVTYLLSEHGRAVCTARKNRCGECVLADMCPSAFAA